MSYLGDFKASGSVNFNFTTHAAAGGAVAPSSGFEAADLIVYKAASATQRSSASGITMTSPFDSIVGLHHVTIDLSDNTDAGFWAAGNDYFVILSPDETVDSQTVVGQVASFSIENRVVNWAQVTSPTTTVGLSGTTVATATNTGTLNGAATVVLTDASLTTAKLGAFALAKTTNITGFNDIAATAVVSSGAITTSGGAVSTVTNTTQLNGAATVTLANGGHGGSATELTLKKLNVTNSAGNAVEFVSTGGNGHGLYVIGDGAGDGVHWLGGATGNGLNAQGGVTSGNGVNATALGTGVPISGSITGNLTGSVNSVTTGVTITGTTATLDALQTAQNSAHGAGSWATATGFSTHTAADVWAVATRTLSGTLGSFDAIWTKIKKWLQLGFRKDAAIATDNATELTEINTNGGSGAGGYLSTTDSQEAIRDRGDTAWTGGGGGGSTIVVNSTTSHMIERVQASTITLYYNENGYTIGPNEVLNDNVAVDLTTFTSLRFTIEDKTNTDLLVTTSVTISGASSSYWQVTGTSAATLTAPVDHKWSLRGIGTNINVLLAHGTVEVRYAADLDA